MTTQIATNEVTAIDTALIEAGLDTLEIADQADRTRIAIAFEILMMDKTNETKTSISKRHGVSRSSADRYAKKYEEEAYGVLDYVNAVHEAEEVVEEPAEETEATPKKVKAQKEEKSSEPKVDLEEFENRGNKQRLVDELKTKGVDQGRGRKMVKSMEEREFWMDMSRFSEDEKEVIKSYHLRLIFKIGGHKRTQKPMPEAILRYEEMKAKGQSFEEYLANVKADGLTEKEGIKHYRLAKVYAEVK